MECFGLALFTLFELANFRTVLSKPVMQQSTPVMEHRCSWYSTDAFSNLEWFNILVSILQNQGFWETDYILNISLPQQTRSTGVTFSKRKGLTQNTSLPAEFPGYSIV